MSTLPTTTVDFVLAGLENFMIRTGQGPHRAVTVLKLRGRPHAAELEASWQKLHANQPMLGAKLRRRWRGWRLVWKTSGAVVAPPIIWHPPQEAAPSDEIIRQRLCGLRDGKEWTTPLSMEVFPCGEDHFILLTWRHALLDGTGVNLLLERLAEGGGSTPPVLPQPKRESMKALYQRARPLTRRLHAMTCAGSLSAWCTGMPLHGKPCFRLIQLTAEETRAAAEHLRELCGDFMQMPFYASVAARIVRHLHQIRGWQSPELHLQIPFQPRGRPRDLIFGNHMGTLPLFLDAAAMSSPRASTAHVVEKYREAMMQGRAQATEAMMTLAAHMPISRFVPMMRWTNQGQICSIFHSHTGVFLPTHRSFAGAEVQDVYTIPGVCSPPGLGLFFSECGGRLTATLSWREGGVSIEEVDALCRELRSDLLGGVQ